MNISSQTPQADLVKLTELAIRRYLYSALPFNGKGIRTLLLFILFPGMIFGFWQGLILTALTTAGMIFAVIANNPALSQAITQGYLIWGGVTALGIAISTFRSAIKEANRRRAYVPALTSPTSAITCLTSPKAHLITLKKEGDGWIASQEIEIGEKGVYFFVVNLSHCDWATPPVLQSDAPACMIEWSKKEQPEQAFTAFRMEAGRHCLSMRLGAHGRRKERPRAELTQIN